MLVRHYIIFIFRIRRLVLRRDVDEFLGEVGRPVEFFEEVGMAGGREVDVGVGGIFRLFWGGDVLAGVQQRGLEHPPLWRVRLKVRDYSENSG